jgi:hypothetical protein
VLTGDLRVEAEQLRACGSSEAIHDLRAPSLDEMSDLERAHPSLAAFIAGIFVDFPPGLIQHGGESPRRGLQRARMRS